MDAPAGVATLTGAQVREFASRPARPRAAAPRGEAVTEPGGDGTLWRRRLRHDIRHELGTIIMLASAVAVADDIGEASRARVEQLLGETRWLDHLLRRLDGDDDDRLPGPERIRVDELTAEVVTGIKLSTAHEVCFDGAEAWAHMDPVALWRAVRNVLDNACRVAHGRVDVHVTTDHGWVTVQVDDDGPGFGAAGSRGLASLGLGIVHDLVSGYGGSLEIRTCEMGGARVRLLLPAAPAPDGPDPYGDDWRPHP
ncbi:sensor histidine kinase [Actinomadura algeriensis]|uniref:histidine kinase n=1 Tax=Actinomadura algeriensis TaxID=1679523 RepID=A0ABR9JL46_9ACTN|nr:sensor histidine kinase [Actinomadura algeriensis]MBE1531279.1 signal transduction histidine kinase [Actinomadura algeriensis]